jgi:ankyrin repeat protein
MPAVVKMLLDTGKVDVQSGRTTLWWAAQNGNKAVVKMLLDTGKVDVNAKDQSGDTLLSWAAQNGCEAVVKILLDTGNVDVDSKDQSGRTPLSWAAGNAYAVMHDTQPNVSGNHALQDYQMQLMLLEQQNKKRLLRARRNQDMVTVVELLLKVGKANVVLTDNHERTPLHWAAHNGPEAIIKVLLDTGRVSVNSKD